MTAVNVLATPLVGFLSADAAVWNADGTVREVASKIIVCPGARTAVAARGVFSQGFLRLALHRQSTVEAVIEAAQTFVRSNAARVEADASWSGWAGSIEIKGVSWYGDKVVSWTVGDKHAEPMLITGLRYSPDLDVSLSDALGAPVHSSAAFAALDPRASFLALMEAQRRMTFETVAGGLHCVGGRCELAVVTERGVAVETLRTWPDEIGQRITP